ncbi:hypothetical protein [Chitinophaga sp. S165]|uniref:hypothetical protein n=1 Tax=Chitinophaga sp. S165 TaxID=2135462 RepID=UPI000D710626|nr:hypothetical protein [Chitinophaga sp. S165]PWV49017.1 hypothetical protein C7475_106263 [Chitinophaga sp. S165]
MSESSFEDFVRQHRQSFEETGPSSRVWAQLEQQIAPRRKNKVIQLMGRHWLKAAAVLVLVVNSVMIWQFIQMKKAQHLTNVSPEMQEAKMYYTTQIEQRLQTIKTYPDAVLGLDSTARKELELRNETYQILEAELIQNPGNERIKAAMVRYYQLKLDLLDKILEELREKQPVSKKQSDYEREI